MYGKELIFELRDCNSDLFNREKLEEFFEKLCNHIDMEKCDLHFWDYEGNEEEYEKAPKHLKGISAIQFISTSNITIHTLEHQGYLFVNLFSCKDFNESEAMIVTKNFFSGDLIDYKIIERGIEWNQN